MECTYIYNGKPLTEFQLVQTLIEELQKGQHAESTIKLFSIDNNLQNAVVKDPEGKLLGFANAFNFLHNLRITDTDEVIVLGEGMADVGTRVMPEYNTENRIEAEIKNWKETHPGETITEEVKNEIEKTISQDDLKGKIHQQLRSFIISSFYNDESTVKSQIRNWGKNLSDLDSSGNYKNEDLLQVLFGKERDIFKIKSNRAEDIKYLTNFIYNEIQKTVFQLKSNHLKWNHAGGTYAIGKNDDIKVKAKIGFVGLTDIGGTETVNVIEFVGGGKDYKDWDSAKKLEWDYRLGLDRTILEKNGIPSQKMSLSIIPISFTYGDFLNSFGIGDIVNRSAESVSKSGLGENGLITRTLKQFGVTPPSMEEPASEALNKAAANVFAISKGAWTPRVEINLNNIDAFINKVKSRKKEDGKYVFHKQIGTKSKKVTASTEEELREEVIKYFEEKEKDKTALIKDIIETFNTKVIKASSSEEINISDLFGVYKDSSIKKYIQFNFAPYLNGEWEAMDNPILISNGIIALQNKNKKIIDLFTLTSGDLLTSFDLQKLGGFQHSDTILGAYLPNDEAYKIDPQMPPATNANLEIMKTLAVINTIPSIFKNYSLGNITCMSVKTGESERCDQHLFDTYNKLASLAKIPNELYTGKIIRASAILRLSHEVQSIFDKIPNRELRNKVNSNLEKLGDLGESDEIIQEKIKLLHTIISDVESEYNLQATEISEKSDFSRPEIYLLGMLSEVLNFYTGLSYTNEGRLSKYGIKARDFICYITDIFVQNRSRIMDDGRMVVGVAQGSDLSGSANVPSTNIRNVLRYVDGQILRVRNEVNQEVAKTQTHTIKFYKEMGLGNFDRFVIGDNYSLYQGLFETNDDGKIASEFKVKDPFDMSNDLVNAQREYLKNILWQIHKHFIPKLTVEQKKSSFEEVKDLEQVRTYINEGKFFKIPLKRGSDLSRWHQMNFSDVYNSYVGQKMQELRDLFDLRQLDEEQAKYFNSKKKNHSIYPDLYGIDENTRQNFLDSKDIYYWETNLDIIAMDVAFSAAKRVIFTETLTNIRHTLWAWKMMSQRTGVDINEVLNFLENQIKITIFNEPILDDELEDAAKAIQLTRIINSAFKLSLRPFQWVKEMTVGWIRNWSIALANVIKNDDYSFGFEDVSAAMKFMIGHVSDRFGQLVRSSDDDIASFTLLNGLNNYYGIANMDINSIVQKLKTDRYGFGAGLSKWMYWCSTNPDLYNRMVMFVAQMHKDGCLEAHTMKNGVLVYDMSKDKRFSEYYAHRHEKGYTSKEFQKQKALYNIMMQEFIANGVTNEKGELVKIGDDLPAAYTTRQKNNLKELSDTMYGCYDHEAKMQFEHNILGLMWFQFKTYWSGTMRRWFSQTNAMTSKGHFEQAKDADGKLQYRKFYTNPDGSFYIVTLSENDKEYDETCEPVMIWQGDFMEGCYVSIVKTIRDCGYYLTNSVGITNRKLDFSRERLSNCLLGLHDLLVAYLFWQLMDLIFFGEPATEYFKDKDKNYSGEEVALLKMRNIIRNSASEFGIDQTLPFNTWTPTQFQSLYKGINDFMKNIKADDPDFGRFLERNISAIGDFTEVKVRK